MDPTAKKGETSLKFYLKRKKNFTESDIKFFLSFFLNKIRI